MLDSQNVKPERYSSTLISRNVTVNGHRTSIRLEPAMWEGLTEICRREKLSLHQLAGMIAERKGAATFFTAAVRVFAMSYFRTAATEEGHRVAGHGSAFLFSGKKDFAGIEDKSPQRNHAY
jgi:predicted DNA-binding ribbon-helix-helix protein